jgi:hypothetical protein
VVVLWLCLLSLALGSDLPAFLFQHALWKLLSHWHNYKVSVPRWSQFKLSL